MLFLYWDGQNPTIKTPGPPLSWLRDWLFYEGRLRKLEQFHLAMRRLRGESNQCIPEERVQRWESWAPFDSAQRWDWRQQPQTQEALSERRAILSLCWGWLSTDKGFLRRLWGPHALRYSKAVWTWSWVACFRWPCLSRDCWTRWVPEVLSNLINSGILQMGTVLPCALKFLIKDSNHFDWLAMPLVIQHSLQLALFAGKVHC